MVFEQKYEVWNFSGNSGDFYSVLKQKGKSVIFQVQFHKLCKFRVHFNLLLILVIFIIVGNLRKNK